MPDAAASPSLDHLLAEVPAKSEFNPVQSSIAKTTQQGDEATAAVLKQFSSMPPSTGIIANPVRYRGSLECNGTPVAMDVRSFGIRGIVFEEDIVTGAASTLRVIFAGLFGRDLQNEDEQNLFSGFLAQSFFGFVDDRDAMRELARFIKAYPQTPPDLAMQYLSCFRKARDHRKPNEGGINTRRPAAEILKEMIQVHLENVAAGACSAWMRRLLEQKPEMTAADLEGQTAGFVPHLWDSEGSPFRAMFSLLLGRAATDDESRILGRMGTIQIHHGSAGSNMVARYLGTLHTRSVSDLFTASQMALDSARHFGAITDMSEFVDALGPLPEVDRDLLITHRILRGGLPTFGHPEIAAAGRSNRVEMDPRPALYLAPLLEAMDRGTLQIPPERRKRLAIAQRIYQQALVDGVEKGSKDGGRLRLAPNTDFGAWCVQEALGIKELDRTLISYAYRGFGWMMDVREQLQEKIIRPVIPPDPAIVPKPTDDTTITGIIQGVHDRLRAGTAFS